jgi:DNA-binding beta-propeller fold protein YncE
MNNAEKRKLRVEVILLASIIGYLSFLIYIPEITNGLPDNQDQNSKLVKNDENQTIPWIGIESVNITKGIANVLGIKEPSGVLVTDVAPRSPAENAGLRGGNKLAPIYEEIIKLGGDIILKADNKTITNSDDLESLVGYNKTVGDSLRLTILRDSQQKVIDITVGSKPGVKYISASDYTNPTNAQFLSYEDIDLGIEIQYPLHWEKEENEYAGSITFRSPLENIEDRARDYVRLFIYPISYMTLDEVVSVKDTLQNLSIIEHPYTTALANNSALGLIYTYTDNRYGLVKAMKIATQQNDNIYLFTYLAQASKFDTYLPTIQYMIDSFNILHVQEYENFDIGMRMKYLPSWNITEEKESFFPATFASGYNVTFFPFAKKSNSSMFLEYLKIHVSEPLQDLFTAQQDSNYTVEYYETLGDNRPFDYPNFELIESGPAQLENIKSIHNVTYSYGDPDFGIIIETHIIAIQNNRLYSISYSSGQEEYSNHIPVINDMIKSIEFFTPLLHIGDELGLILKYPSDLQISQTTNKSMNFCFGYAYPDDICDGPELAINVYEKENSYYSETSYNINTEVYNTTINLTTTQGKPLQADKRFREPDSENDKQIMRLNTTLKNRAYEFIYRADSDEYGQYITTVEKIINSTKIIDGYPVAKVDVNNPERSGFIPYKSPTFGFSIRYPMDWYATDYGKGLVEFTSKKDYENSPFIERPPVSVIISVAPTENLKLYDFVESDIGFVASENNDFKVIDSNPINHRNNPAYQIEYTTTEGSMTMMTMTNYILNDKNKNIYYIIYNGELDEFYNFKPIVDEMVNSIEFNNTGKSTTYTGFKVGDGPLGIAVNPNTNMIYVANSLSSTVSVVNGSDDRILANIPLSNVPISIAVNPFKNIIYVTHAGSISVINSRNNSLMTTIPIDARSPLAIAVNPTTDMIYVADGQSKNISVIDGIINEEKVSIPTGISKDFDPFKQPGIGVAVDLLRNRVYVANPSTDNITVIDGRDNRILSNISATTIRPFDIAVNPLTNIAYIVGETDLAKIDLLTNKIEKLTTGSSFNTVAVNPLTNIVYVPDQNWNTVYAINSTHQKEIAADSRPSVVSVNPNTNTIYVTNAVSDTVTKINGSTNKVIFGVRFDINDGITNYEILGYKFPVTASKEVDIYCSEKNISDNDYTNERNISDNDYISVNNGTFIICTQHPKNSFSPLVSTFWSGFVSTEWSIWSSVIQSVLSVFQNPLNAPVNALASPAGGGIIPLSFITAIMDASLASISPIEFNVTRYGVQSGTFLDLAVILQGLGLLISVVGVTSVILIASIPSIINRFRKEVDTGKQELLSKTEVIAIDASVIVGVLFFLTISEGFEISEQTHITIVSANIVFPFAISAVLEVINREKFAMRLMIAGFINLMISVVLIAIMRL